MTIDTKAIREAYRMAPWPAKTHAAGYVLPLCDALDAANTEVERLRAHLEHAHIGPACRLCTTTG